MDIPAAPGEDDNNIKDLTITMSIMNLVVDEEGEYNFDFYINDDKDYTTNLLFSIARLRE